MISRWRAVIGLYQLLAADRRSTLRIRVQIATPLILVPADQLPGVDQSGINEE
jgi:hypothetical protein